MTADHSSYYCTAVAILERAVGPDQFTEEKLRDPRVRELIDKVVVEPDPELEEFGWRLKFFFISPLGPRGRVEMRLNNSPVVTPCRRNPDTSAWRAGR
ncbi:MAG: MmgE/PrpD family protein [Deltaproteobacteria bacterium]|nr:MmgE/PrpD family protein [Deltaproteobacteria bacterium]